MATQQYKNNPVVLHHNGDETGCAFVPRVIILFVGVSMFLLAVAAATGQLG